MSENQHYFWGLALRERKMRIQCGIYLGGKQQGQLEKTTFGGARDNSPVRIGLIKWEMSVGARAKKQSCFHNVVFNTIRNRN